MGRRLETNRTLLDRIAKIEAAPLVPKTSWYDVASHVNGWSSYGTPYAHTGFRKDSSGTIWLRGALKGASFGSAAFEVPPGFRPAHRKHFIVPGADYPNTYVQVEPNGSVTPFETMSNRPVRLAEWSHFGTEFNATYGGWPFANGVTLTTFANSSYPVAITELMPTRTGYDREFNAIVALAFAGAAGSTACNVTVSIGVPEEVRLFDAMSTGAPFTTVKAVPLSTGWTAMSSAWDSITSTKQFIGGNAVWGGTAGTVILRSMIILARYVPNNTIDVPLDGISYLAEL